MQPVAAAQHRITRRWLEVEGELRVALLRVLLLALFYSAQLISYLSLTQPSAAEHAFHRHSTWLSAVWAFASLAVLVLVARNCLPPSLKYICSLCDVLLLTLMASAGSGPASPLVMIYLLLVVMAGMRGSLPLIWVTTLAAMLAYLWLVIAHGQFMGQSLSPLLESVNQKPVAMMIAWLSIAATGVVTGQLVRMLKQIVTEVCERSASVQVAPSVGEGVAVTGTASESAEVPG